MTEDEYGMEQGTESGVESRADQRRPGRASGDSRPEICGNFSEYRRRSVRGRKAQKRAAHVGSRRPKDQRVTEKEHLAYCHWSQSSQEQHTRQKGYCCHKDHVNV